MSHKRTSRPNSAWPDSPESLAFHEMKNQLGVALINASLLAPRLDPADERSRHHLALVRQSLGTLKATCEQLCEHVRLLIGPAALKLEPLPVAALLEEALDCCRADCEGRSPAWDGAIPADQSVLGERPTTSRMLAMIFTACLDLAEPGATLAVKAEAKAMSFELAGPARPTEPGRPEPLALHTGAQLVRMHRGRWETPELGPGAFRLAFTLPRA